MTSLKRYQSVLRTCLNVPEDECVFPDKALSHFLPRPALRSRSALSAGPNAPFCGCNLASRNVLESQFLCFFFCPVTELNTIHSAALPENFMRLLLGHRRLLNGSPLWTAASIHSETMLSLRPLDPPSYWSVCAYLPGVAHLLFSA